MSSSDYAQISDVAPARAGSERSKIYDEISELQSAGERNIFGVKLRSSFQRAHPPPTKSQCLEEPQFPKLKPTVTSFKPIPSSTGKKQPTNEPKVKPEEPVYAKPNKPDPQSNIPAQTIPGNKNVSVTPQPVSARKFNKPPPTFSPPPPPSFSAKEDDKSSKETKSPEYALPICDPQNTAVKDTQEESVNSTEVERVIVEAGYAEITVLDGKKEEDVEEGKENSDDDHTYYLADSISRSASDIKEINSLTNEGSQGSDDTKSQQSNANGDDTGDTKSKTKSEGAYEDIDLSQVVRRKRGSHVTVSFSEESFTAAKDVSDETSSTLKNNSSVVERRSNFRSKPDELVVDETYENHDVFVDNAQVVDKSNERGYEHTEYGKALISVIDGMLDSATEKNKSNINGKAFTHLKEYLERHSQEGFDLEDHRLSCRNSIERLQALLMS